VIRPFSRAACLGVFVGSPAGDVGGIPGKLRLFRGQNSGEVCCYRRFIPSLAGNTNFQRVASSTEISEQLFDADIHNTQHIFDERIRRSFNKPGGSGNVVDGFDLLNHHKTSE